MTISSISPDAKKIVGTSLLLGGVIATTVSVLAAKSIIVLGIASQAIPIVGAIAGIALLILGALLFYRTYSPQKPLQDKEIELVRLPTDADIEPPTAEAMNLEIRTELSPLPKEESPLPALVEPDPLTLANSDKLMFASNAVQWALIGAAYAGAAPSIIFPASVLAGLGSEIASFCMLPKDASWLRKALSVPVLSNWLIHYNPWISRLFKLTSLYNLASHSISKLGTVWQRFKEDPKKAVVAGFTHLVNLGSGVAFAAESARLIRLRPEQKPKCPPRAKANLPCSNCGMFATGLYLIGVLDRFKQGKYSGVRIDFEKDGLYYDRSQGKNWFEYYFNPVNIANPECVDAPEKSFTDHELGDHSSYAEGVYGYEETGVPRARAKTIIETHLTPKPDIQSEMDQFKKTHFSDSDHVIGVHYRGTDKISEARRVPYEEMLSKIQEQVEEIGLTQPKKLKIFAASDEEGFISQLERRFPGQVVASPAKRSTNGKPLHFNAKNPYQVGKEALMDCWLLGRLSDTLIRTSSNLSKFAALMLKPGAKEIEVSKRSYQDSVKAS